MCAVVCRNSSDRVQFQQNWHRAPRCFLLSIMEQWPQGHIPPGAGLPAGGITGRQEPSTCVMGACRLERSLRAGGQAEANSRAAPEGPLWPSHMLPWRQCPVPCSRLAVPQPERWPLGDFSGFCVVNGTASSILLTSIWKPSCRHVELQVPTHHAAHSAPRPLPSPAVSCV